MSFMFEGLRAVSKYFDALSDVHEAEIEFLPSCDLPTQLPMRYPFTGMRQITFTFFLSPQ